MARHMHSAAPTAAIDERDVEGYRSTVRSTFAFLKATTRLDDLFAKSVRLEDDRGFLVPVCELHADDEALIAQFAAWREQSTHAFPTQFPVTLDGTRSWLRSRLLDVEDRLLFLIVDRHGRPVGHLGFASAINDERTLEVDNVVRGVDGAEPGIMSASSRALLDWAEANLAPAEIFLRVFADNDRAIGFYERLGFRRDRTIPLRREESGDSVSFVETEGEGDREFLRMVYAPERVVDGSTTILTAGPHISAREASYALDAARFGWNSQWSRYLTRFEQEFAEYVGTKHAIATSSCTGALHLSLLGLGIGPGDEVIVPDITWVATANAVMYTGATPVFADVEEGTWCLDPDSFEAQITEHTKAVMPVHLYGQPARMDRICEIAERHGLKMVEDAAPAIGATFGGRKTGTFGDAAAFSFQGAKLVVAGEGGMLVTDDTDLYERIRLLWDQGRDATRTFWINKLGWKYKMSNVQAAIGLGQLQQAEHLISAKRRVFSWYEEELAGVEGLRLQRESPEGRSIYWMTNAELEEGVGIERDELRKVMLDRGVDTRPVFPAISQYPIWPRPQEPQPTALRVGQRAINLPSGVLLRREHVAYVGQCLREAVGR